MNRYFSSFFLTLFIYLILTFFVVFLFADSLIVEDNKQDELKIIALNHVTLEQKEVVSEAIIEPEPLVEVPTPIKKKIEKPKKENIQKKIVEKKEIEKPSENKNLQTDTHTNENQKSDIPNEIKQTKVDAKEYLDRNLALIRSLINENIKYPTKAKKLFIQGTVVVKFKILENGTVVDIEIVSGHTLLNTSTIEAIEEASKKFPKSNESVIIQLPIEYKLQ